MSGCEIRGGQYAIRRSRSLLWDYIFHSHYLKHSEDKVKYLSIALNEFEDPTNDFEKKKKWFGDRYPWYASSGTEWCA